MKQSSVSADLAADERSFHNMAECGGGVWWRRVVAEGGGGVRWRSVVAECGNGVWWRSVVAEVIFMQCLLVVKRKIVEKNAESTRF